MTQRPLTTEEKKQKTRDRIDAARKKCGLAPLEYANPQNQEEINERKRKIDQDKKLVNLKTAAEKYQEAINSDVKVEISAQQFRGAWNMAAKYTKEQTIAEGPEHEEATQKALRKCLGGGW